MAVDIPSEVLGHGEADGLCQLDAFGFLGGHVYHDIGGDTVCLVGQPFDGTCVNERGHPDGLSLVVNLAVNTADLELGYVLYHGSHFPVS